MDHRVLQASGPSIMSLLTGIITDVRDLFMHELTAAKLEVQEELGQAKHAAATLSIGIGVSTVGGLLLALMLVHMLAAYADISLWVCYGIVGGITTVLGAMFLHTGRRRADRVHLIPEQNIETAKEDIPWTKDQIRSNKT